MIKDEFEDEESDDCDDSSDEDGNPILWLAQNQQKPPEFKARGEV